MSGAPQPGYRAISKSSRFSTALSGVYGLAMGVVSLDNKSYVMDDIEYAGGVSNFYDTSFPANTLWESYYGVYLLVFVAGPNLLSDIFQSSISNYTGCAFYSGPSAATNFPIANAADLLSANQYINPKDIDFVTGYNSLVARLDEPTIWQSLANTRIIASLHIPLFAGQNLTGWIGNTGNQYNKVSQTFVIPPGYKYLVTLPVIGLWTNQTLGAADLVYNGSFRCSLNLNLA